MNKSVFISGGTANTGFGVSEKFAKEGYNVFIGSRNLESSEKVANMLSEKYGVYAKGYRTVSCDEENVNEIFCDIEKQGFLVDSLVLVAADLGVNQEFLTVDIKDFSTVINTNITWNFMLVRAAAKHMMKRGGGSVVFINSNTAYRTIPNRIAYSASKSGALGMMRALALDLGKYKIRVNAVLPGMIKTDRWEKNLNDVQNAPSRYTPLGDIASFDDIANAVWYFASDMSLNTTGAELVVDGGNTIQLYPIIEDK